MKVGVIETHHSHTVVPSVVVHDTSKDLGLIHKGEDRYVKYILCQFGFFILIIYIGLSKHIYLLSHNFVHLVINLVFK